MESGFEDCSSFESIEKEWFDLLPYSFTNRLPLTPIWQKLWWEKLATRADLHILTFHEAGSLQAIAPLMYEDACVSFVGSSDLFDEHDFIVNPASIDLFFPAFARYLDLTDLQKLSLESIPEHSPTLAYLPELLQKHGWNVDVIEEDLTMLLSLPPTWDAYLADLKKKDRHEVRRKIRRLEHNGDHNFRLIREPTSNDLDDFFLLMRKSKEEKSLFLTDNRERFFRAIIQAMAHSGNLRLFFLELNNERVASALCFDYENSRLLYNSGFDPTVAHLSTGLLLTFYCIRQATEDGLHSFNFLRGDERYKYTLGAEVHRLYKVQAARQQ